MDRYVVIVNAAASGGERPWHTLSGFIKDGETGEGIPGSSVSVSYMNTIVSTDDSGFFSVKLPSGIHHVFISAVGSMQAYRVVRMNKDIVLDVDMFRHVTELEEVEISGNMIHTVNTLELPGSEITSIEILYEPQTLIETNLKNIFPYGAIAICTSDAASTLTRNMTLHKRFFSGALSWPHVFQHRKLVPENAHDRWPFFKSLYSWQPGLGFTRQKQCSIGEVPVLTPPKYILLLFSLAQIKRETLTEVVLD